MVEVVEVLIIQVASLMTLIMVNVLDIFTFCCCFTFIKSDAVFSHGGVFSYFRLFLVWS